MVKEVFGGKTESKQDRDFTPQAESAMRAELPLFLRTIGTQNQTILDLLRGDGGTTGQGVKRGADLARKIVERAAVDAGIDGSQLADIMETLDPDDPIFKSILAQLAQQVSQSVPSVVDPRLAIGLRPSIEGKTTSTPSPFQIAQGIVSIAGAAAGAACWIARALYGPLDPRFFYARYHVNTALCGTLFYRLYLLYGERLSTYPRLCRILRPLFERFWRKGMNDA